MDGLKYFPLAGFWANCTHFQLMFLAKEFLKPLDIINPQNGNH